MGLHLPFVQNHPFRGDVGVLSHTAVVARGYGIPAVVGTGVETMRIRDGQIVELGGSQGVVRIE